MSKTLLYVLTGWRVLVGQTFVLLSQQWLFLTTSPTFPSFTCETIINKLFVWNTYGEYIHYQLFSLAQGLSACVTQFAAFKI